MNKQFLSPEELKELKSFNNQRNKLTKLFGSLELDIQLIKIEKSKIIEELKTLTDSTNNMATNLQKKYGDGNVNIETGEFIKQ
tara:strand:+ start:602 stop:850 length:249 start_codon:yes stop_codon:yes gene_type:complete